MSEKSKCAGDSAVSGRCGRNAGGLRLLRHLAAMFKALSCNKESNLEVILRTLLRVVPGRMALCNRFDYDRREIIVRASHRLPGGFRLKGRFEGRICYEELAKCGKGSVFFNDLTRTPFFFTDPDVKHSGLRAYAGAAILSAGVPVGSLAVYSSKPNCFCPDDTLVLEIMAELICLVERPARFKCEINRIPVNETGSGDMTAAVGDFGRICSADACGIHHFATEELDRQHEPSVHHRILENLVKARTDALRQANERLTLEVMKRIQIADEFRRQSERLKELNTALGVLLDKHNEDRMRSEESMRLKLRELIEPYLNRLENSGLNATQKQFLDLMRTNLEDVVRDPISARNPQDFIFSPNELQVANLIRKGKTTKEVAKLMGISDRTVESYRHSIRKKLNLRNKKVNLKTYLSSQ